LYLDLFVLPATPIYDPNKDQLLNLHNATRMLDGQMIYRDFFQFTTPGTELIYFALFRLFGVRAWIPNAMLVLLGLSVTWLCIFISRKIFNGLTVYLPALLFLLLSLHPTLDGTHQWYSMLAVMAATASVMEERSPTRVAGAAALCALASFFTQTRGVAAIAGLAVFLWWEHPREPQGARSLLKTEALLAGVFSAVTVGLNLYFIWAAGLQRFLWCTVTFMLKYYPTDAPSNNLQAYMAFMPSPPHWYHPALLAWIFIHALLPLVYLLFFARCWRESRKRPEQPWDRLMLLSLMGLFLFSAVAPAPDYGRLCAVAFPGLIIFVWFLIAAGKLHFLARQVLWLSTGIVLVGSALHSQTRRWVNFDSPIGRVALYDSQIHDRYEWLRSHTHPGQFLFDGRGEVYYLLGLRSPAEVQFLAYTDYLRPGQVRNVVESLETWRVSMVLWCPGFDAGAQGYQPGDHLGPLRAYLNSHYHQVTVLGNDVEVLERNGPPVSASDAIR
jgi:hypothetical protein